MFRLFVSSPGDVDAERRRVAAAVAAVNAEYEGRAGFAAEFWEEHFYSAHESFQPQIPEAASYDLVIAIFRGRLGSRLPDDFRKMPSGETYPSGTAYEVLSAIAHRKAGATQPDVYVFRHPQPPTVSLGDPNKPEIEAQWSALSGFFERWFRGPEGPFFAAFQPYEDEANLGAQVEDALRKWLAERGVAARDLWDRVRLGSPFPGLAAFDAGHERVFFGRELALRQTSAALQTSPFLLILGASGAGKSSLLRAGLMPRLARPYAFPGVDKVRGAVLSLGRDPFYALAEALLKPEALANGFEGRFAEPAHLARALAGDAETAKALIADALDRLGAQLVIGLDQAERLFLEAPEAARGFGELLGALSGEVARIVMALRSDAYPRFQAEPALVALRAAGATYDLTPPTAHELAEMVERPIASCDPPLKFGAADPPLAERLVTDAQGGDALPLLQMALARLYAAEARRGDGQLRAEDYSGMADAVSETAGAALEKLGGGGDASLSALVAALVADVAPDPLGGPPIPVIAPLARANFVAGSAERAALIDAFVEARLLISDGDSVRPTHDALLRIWPRGKALVEEMAALLRARAALVPLAREWSLSPPESKEGYLALSGPQLASAQELRTKFGADLGQPLLDFATQAVEADRGRRQQERRRARRTLYGAVAVAVLMAGLAGGAAWQWREAAAERANAEANATIAEAATYLEKVAQETAQAETRLAKLNADEAQKQKAAAERSLYLASDAANAMVSEIAQKFKNSTGIPVALERDVLNEAVALQVKLLEGAPDDPRLLHGEGAALGEAADTLLSAGDSQGALDASRKGLDIFMRLTKRDPGNTEWRRNVSVSYEKLGDAEVAVGQLDAALISYRSSLETSSDLAKSDPGNARLQRDLSVSYDKVGQVEFAEGELAAALESYRSSLEISDRLAKSDPGNAEAQGDLAESYGSLGSVEVAQGRLAEGLEDHRKELEIADRLAKSDPGNARWQRDLSGSLIRIGDVEVAQGQLAAALESYRKSLEIFDRLARSDPGNTGWQRDFSVSSIKVGDVEFAQGQFGAALENYRKSLEIAEHLASLDPGNAGWQRDLSMAYENVGDVEVNQNQLDAALENYRKCSEIADRLAKSDAGNRGLQRDLAVTLSRLADVYARQNAVDPARAALIRGRDIVARLLQLSPDNAQWKQDLAFLEAALAKLPAAKP